MAQRRQRGARRDPRREAYWRRVIDRWQHSGQTIRSFCRQRGISEAGFHGWKRELRRRDEEREGARGPRFVALEVAAEADTTRSDGRIEILLGGDVTLRVGAGFDRRALTEVIATLREAAAC